MIAFNKRLFAALVGLSLAACANAAGDAPANLKADIQKKFPNRPIESVRTTPLKGIYEVVMEGRQIIYTDNRGDFILVGDLVDVKNKVSLTESRMKELTRVDFASLPLDKALKLVRGTGARKVAVFSDPDCPFCKKIERETIAKLDNVTVYTFLYPLAQLHPDAARKSALIWCAADRQKAWQGWMFEGKLPEGSDSCPNPVADTVALADKLGINGTPAMVFESGELVSGAIPVEEFEAKLSAKKTK